jgi:hypothetical protein
MHANLDWHFMPIIFGGDLNLNHESWQLAGHPRRSSAAARALAEWADIMELSKLNDNTSPTRSRSNAILDLVFTNDPLAVEHFSVLTDPGLALHSDHCAIRFDIVITPDDNAELPPRPSLGFVVDTEKQHEWRCTFHAHMTAFPEEIHSTEEVERAAAIIEEACFEASAVNFKRCSSKPSGPSPWWTPECAASL